MLFQLRRGGKILNEDIKRYKKGQRVLWITIILNLILAVGKVTIGLISNSNAILADGVHSFSDVGSSLGLIVGLFIARKPEDIKHQYGHEKAESIASFLLSLLLIAVGLNIGYSSLKLIFTNQATIPGVSAIWAAVISILIKELQFRISKKTGEKINSSALIADAWHHRSDSLSSLAALIGIIGARLGYGFLDPLAGIIVSGIVIKVGFEIFFQGYNELMDISLSEDELKDIVDKIMKHKGVKIVNDIKARKHGSKAFVDIEIAVDPNITVLKGHEIAEDVEEIVHKKIGYVKDVLVHVNPCINKDAESCKMCSERISTFVNDKKD
ncbi:MAG: cation transporter [Firmicutes bacterium]|nr:cation transporter [Bacillota bacterium]